MASPRSGVVISVSCVMVACMAAACAGGDSLGVGGGGGELGVTASSSHASTHAATTAATTAAETSAASTTVAATSGTGGPVCTDPGPGEPSNDTMSGAVDLGDISDSDGDGDQVEGVLGQGGDDVDWYKFHGHDNVGSEVDPTRQAADGGARACLYVECDDGDSTNFDCPTGTSPDTQGGKPGCCWNGGMEVSLNLVCGSSSLNSDNATMYMRIDHPGGPGCESYTVSYHY